ncbi:MAG: hypothetical protein KJO30_04430 [Boseongicola sp.]|jgi:hypothetical protein|nr:hypothetical protein [Boseongicola sp.]NNJ67957.1 hypothetical protein [Boseongicola sp.]
MIGSIASIAPHPNTSYLAMVFPNADPQVVSALSNHAKALTRYLAQIHELTITETVETVEAFFGFETAEPLQSDVA